MAFQLDFEARGLGGVWKLSVLDGSTKYVIELSASEVVGLKNLIEMQGF